MTLQKYFSRLSLVIYFAYGPCYLANSNNRRWSGAPYVNLQKCFWHESLVIYFFFQILPIKLKLEPQINRWGTTDSQPIWTNHYDWLIRNREQQPDHIYYTLLFSGSFCWASYEPQHTLKNAGQNLLSPKLKLACFDFSLSSNLNFESRMLGTAGAAPRPPLDVEPYMEEVAMKGDGYHPQLSLLSSSWAILSYWATCFSYLNISSQVRACGFPPHSQWMNAIPANHLKSFTVVTVTLFNLNSVEKTHVRYIHIYMGGSLILFQPPVYKTSE